jgi:hypothetical protein
VTAGASPGVGDGDGRVGDALQSGDAMLHPDGMAMTLVEILVKLRHLTE